MSRPALARWWLDRSVRTKGLVAVAVPLVCLVGIATASLELGRAERDQRHHSLIDHDIVNTASAVLSDAVNAETGVRGYKATGDELFLDPYTLALSRLPDERVALARAAAAAHVSPEQLSIDSTAASVLAQLASLSASGTAGAATLEALEIEKSTMDDLRQLVARLIEGPTAAFNPERQQISRLEGRIEALDLASLVLAILSGIAGVALIATGISRRVVAAAANAERLGSGQPLEPVVRSRDELGHLADALTAAEALLLRRSEQLILARDAAVQATNAKNAFLSNTSHELRTPLNSIMGFAQLLGMSDLTVEDHDSAERILAGGRHLLVLINELIDIARIESGDLNLSIEPVSLRPVIEQACELMRPLANDRAITIVHDCSNPTIAVLADQQRLSQVLVNLISNAVKYNRREGSITINCTAALDQHTSIAVTDTGRGISADDLDQIFVPFQRLQAAQTTIEGTGIGLTLAKALTEAMSGSLEATSVLHQGSTFTIILPSCSAIIAETDAHHQQQSPRPRHTRSDGPQLTILYIEDNTGNIEVVDRFLRSRPGDTLDTATTGRAGIELASTLRPDIILLDLHLPDLDGEHVLEELKSNPVTSTTPVVILSADATPGVVRRLIAHGASAYLTKPIDLVELDRLLITLLEVAGPQPPQSETT